MKINLGWFLIMLCVTPLLAIDNDVHLIEASKASRAAVIDGKLEPAFWDESTSVFNGKFIQFEPSNGAEASFPTEIKVAYTDFGIYLAAVMYDPSPDSILREIGLRDEWYRNADRFAVGFDTYNNGQNAFYFMVSAAGVQSDFYINGERWDRDWDAVWNSAVKITESGWVAELEIPYSALRFPRQQEYSWGVNFMRETRRYGEESYWKRIDNSRNGFANQFGKLNGIRDVNPPVRLSFTPYVTTNHLRDQVNSIYKSSLTVGMDVKYGLSESFTMDMSLIPDFSQVRSDNVILNLSPFEVRYSENRPYFTEGADLFGKANIFYSRRIGQSVASTDDLKKDGEEVKSKPSQANLLNATKISGRTQSGLGIGLINAVTDKTFVEFEDEETGEVRQEMLDPLTNFNILVVDQSLKNNSSISLINTNVTRFGNHEDANVTGTEVLLFDKSNTYQFFGNAAFSQVMENRKNKTGYYYDLNAGKVSGTFQFMLRRRLETDTYDPNDLGFIQNNNEVTHSVNGSYNIFKKKGIFNRFSTRIGGSHSTLYKPASFINTDLFLSTSMQFTNFWNLAFSLSAIPGMSYNFTEPRVDGMFYVRPSSWDSFIRISSDRRKALSVSASYSVFQRPRWDQFYQSFGLAPLLRVSDRLTFNYDLDLRKNDHSVGFVTKLTDENDVLQDVVFGKRDIQTIENTFGSNFTFNNKMGLNMRMRHYWSQVRYDEFFRLKKNGFLTPIEYNDQNDKGESLHNKNFNVFNVDLVYTMQIAPGSFMSFIWKDSIVRDNASVGNDYMYNFRDTLESPHTNSFSLKLLYYVDYLVLKNRFNL